jgi:nitrous oxide reductase
MEINMKVVITKEEFATLDPLFQAEYKEVDGSFVLNADGIDNHPDVKALKGAYTGEKDKRTAAAKRLEELEAAKKLADEATLTEQQKFKELSELKAKEATDAATALEALRAEVLNGQIDSRASKIATAINATDAKRQKFLANEAKKFLQNTDNGLALVNPDGTPTDEKSVIASLTKDYPFLASGNPASGGDAQGNPSHQQPTTPPKTAGEAVSAAFSGVTA